MPAFAISRQPEALAWFGGGQATALLAQEAGLAREWLSRRPAQPVLWLAPTAQPRPLEDSGNPATRRLWLHSAGTGFAGDVRCRLPLPLPSEAIGSLVVQHVWEAGPAELLEESVRVLAPGGRVLLMSLNPLSPWRMRWSGQSLRVREAAGWSDKLRRLGLHPVAESAEYLGPIWRQAHASRHARTTANGLRAVIVLEAEKRTAALIPPSPARRAWNTGAAPA